MVDRWDWFWFCAGLLVLSQHTRLPPPHTHCPTLPHLSSSTTTMPVAGHAVGSGLEEQTYALAWACCLCLPSCSRHDFHMHMPTALHLPFSPLYANLSSFSLYISYTFYKLLFLCLSCLPAMLCSSFYMLPFQGDRKEERLGKDRQTDRG